MSSGSAPMNENSELHVVALAFAAFETVSLRSSTKTELAPVTQGRPTVTSRTTVVGVG